MFNYDPIGSAGTQWQPQMTPEHLQAPGIVLFVFAVA